MFRDRLINLAHRGGFLIKHHFYSDNEPLYSSHRLEIKSHEHYISKVSTVLWHTEIRKLSLEICEEMFQIKFSETTSEQTQS